MTDRTGHCLCGAVSYRLSADPVATRICWCADCQHIAGNGTANAMVPSAALEISGTLSDYVKVADSGNEIHRRFCPICGTQMFANSSARPQFTVLRIGTLDNPSSIRPAANIWTRSAPAWAHLDPALDHVEQQPLPPLAPAPAQP